MIADFFRNRLDQMIDLRHPLAVLSNRMQWQELEASLAHRFAHQIRAGKRVEDSDLFGSALHFTSHEFYSRSVRRALAAISKMPCAAKRTAVMTLQETLREGLRRKGNPVVNGEGASESMWDDIIARKR